jgi:predicted P-loop ATPase
MTLADGLREAGLRILPFPDPTPTVTKSEAIINTLKELGYEFRLNLCDDTIEVNGEPLSDVLEACIRSQLRDQDMKLYGVKDAYIVEAERNAYHPVRDWLNGLVWDQERDYILELAKLLEDDDPPVVYPDGTTWPLHTVYLYRWLIGAVAKALDGHQNAMLVLDGPQGIGKSQFARWLCSGIPGYFLEGPINIADKDTDIRLMTRFIWEVSELDATTRRADVSALKAFITKQSVTVRKSYGKYDITKPALASLIGTVNNSSGFLADETGSRRFYVTRLTNIDWSYTAIPIDQVWANAVALYRGGEPHTLQANERAAQQQNNARYEVESTLDDYLYKYFLITGDPEHTLRIGDIVEYLAEKGVRLSGSERAQAMELSRVLTRMGVVKRHTRAGNVWAGITRLEVKTFTEAE